MTSASPFLIHRDAPQSDQRHPHEGFFAVQDLQSKLRNTVQGEVRFDDVSRALYATDASNYRQVPIGLVVPRNEDDIRATVAACREFGAPVLSRGGETSLAGQCCNVAVVMDFSKCMHSIVELDPVVRRARVQPGIVLDALRLEAEKHELTFALDPATHSRCTLGGMIGNNSCSVHALMGGMTVDNIDALDILLYDGTRMRVGEFTIQSDGSLLLFMDCGTIAIWREGTLVEIVPHIQSELDSRFNGVIADPRGRFFCGTEHLDFNISSGGPINESRPCGTLW